MLEYGQPTRPHHQPNSVFISPSPSRNIRCMDLININAVRLEVNHIAADPTSAGLAPLVFLHEGLGSVALWRDWPTQACAATGRVGCVYSRGGYGQSDPVADVRGPARLEAGRRVGRLLPDYLHVEAWAVLPKLFQALQIEKPILIGHSDGGSIALLYASCFPVSGVVVLAPHVIVEDVSIASIRQAKTAFETGDLRARLLPYHADVDGAFWQWNDVWLSDGFRNFDIREACRTITAPVMAIQGMDDPYGTMFQIDEISRMIDARASQSCDEKRVLLQKFDNCGHSPHRDQPERTTQVIADFLRNLP